MWMLFQSGDLKKFFGFIGNRIFLYIIYYTTNMSTGFLGDQILAVGHAFSIVGLIMAPISTLCCRMYSRILDMCQILYLFAIVLAPMTEKFSIYLDWSWLYWMPAFLPCKEYIKSSYVCSQGNLLSVLIILVGVIIVTFIIVKIFACNRENLTFSPFYSFLKGFFRWI